MPPTQEMIDKAVECLGDTTVTFTATPTTIRPGHTTTLNWKVTSPSGCGGQILLNNTVVAKTGSRTLEPSATTVYRLIGRMFTVQRTLATVTVNVDTGQCFSQAVDEETVRQMVRSLIESNLAGSPLSQRSPASVEIDQTGVAVKLRLSVAVPNFFDPDLDVDMVIAVGASNHQPVVSFRSYSNDLHWPWWVTGITLGITSFIDGAIESRIEQKVKPLLLEKLKEQINSLLGLIPPTHRLQALTTEPNAIRALVCPIA